MGCMSSMGSMSRGRCRGIVVRAAPAKPGRGPARSPLARPTAEPAWSKAVTSAAWEAAGSSTRGSSGWVPSKPASLWECRAAQSRQACNEEVEEPWWGTTMGPL